MRPAPPPGPSPALSQAAEAPLKWLRGPGSADSLPRALQAEVDPQQRLHTPSPAPRSPATHTATGQTSGC